MGNSQRNNFECTPYCADTFDNLPKTAPTPPVKLNPATFSLSGGNHEIKNVSLSRNNAFVIFRSDEDLYAYEINSGKQIWKKSVQATCLSVSNILTVAAGKRFINVYNLESGALLKTIQCRQSILCCDIDSGGTHIITGNDSNVAQVWNFSSGRCVRNLLGHRKAISECRFLENGQRAITSSLHGHLILWNLQNGLPLHRFVGHRRRSGINNFCVSRDEALCISAGQDETLKFWDLLKGWERPISSINVSGHIYCCKFSSDGSYIFVGTEGQLRLVNLDIRETSNIDTQYPVHDIAISHDGFVLYTCDTGIRILNVADRIGIQKQEEVFELHTADEADPDSSVDGVSTSGGPYDDNRSYV